jgi:hypothetical protein
MLPFNSVVKFLGLNKIMNVVIFCGYKKIAVMTAETADLGRQFKWNQIF